MNINIEYQNTLIRMLFVESLGECMYNVLSSKTADEESASIYKRLSLNEAETAGRIVNEMKRLDISVPTTRASILKITALTVFSVLSQNILKNLLKNTLNKRMFRLWFSLYHEYNEQFWQSMIDHEVLQYELLEL